MNIKDQMAEALKVAREIAEKAQADKRDLTAEEQTSVEGLLEKADRFGEQIRNKQKSDQLLADLAASGRELTADTTQDVEDHSLGGHFLKHAGAQLKSGRGSRFSIGAPEYKATPVTRGTLSEIQTRPGAVTLPLRRPVVADLILSGVMGGTTLQYFVEGAISGGPGAVAESGLKPELSGGFTAATEVLTKLAGWTKESDELIEDFPALASVVNNRLLVRLAILEENQILNGSGTAPELKGILQRSGLLTIASGTATGATAVLKAKTAIMNATFNEPDFLVLNPTDYERERLRTDSAGQYLGGGPFQNQYGNGPVPTAPGLWGLNTVVTAAMTAGTALVGTGSCAQVFRKGGVRVDSTNTDQDDFVNNRMTVRVEERLLLAVYYPAAFCTVTMS